MQYLDSNLNTFKKGYPLNYYTLSHVILFATDIDGWNCKNMKENKKI